MGTDRNLALVTGAEQGLGSAIKTMLEAQLRIAVINLPGNLIMWGHEPISKFIEQLPTCPYYIINNFGINHLSPIGTTPSKDKDILNVKVMGPYWVVNAIRKFHGGPCSVINVASQTYKVPQRYTALYCASKAAL